MLEQIKESMRIKHPSLDNDIRRNIEACKLDLKIAGVVIGEDALSEKACELYTKWQYDYLGKGVQFETAYQNLKNAMALSGEYHV